MSAEELVVGIDLGTTNSEIAAFDGGRVRVLGPGDGMLPSCVGLSPAGELLIGAAARNQQLLYPERTVRSVKRRMGLDEKVVLGEREFTPPEVSALILRQLAEWASRELGREVRRAVITVPAYFSDAQRSATREAGALAGLEIVRILNEPTAASLAYGCGDGRRRTLLVYDLGGGTFDVSLVVVEGDVTEVLASHGNNRLGGDDFNDLLAEHLTAAFQEKHGVDLRKDPVARSRVWWAAEEAKKRLSAEPYARVREEALASAAGVPLHLDLEIARSEYEGLIRPLVEGTLESVAKALEDAGRKPADLDAVLLVGGSTRTPLVQRTLEERLGVPPRADVHPDLAVALGAGVLASRLAGRDVDRVLVDVSPYSFGPSYLGERDGEEYEHCYHPVLRRNTPLPVTRTERYFTSAPYQTLVEVNIYQGDDPDALRNVPVGRFVIDGLTPMSELNEVLCRMSLDVDGLLRVTAVEKRTGKSKQVTIRDACRTRTEEEVKEAAERLRALFAGRPAEEPAERLEADGMAEGEADDDGSAMAEEQDPPVPAEVEEEGESGLALPVSDPAMAFGAREVPAGMQAAIREALALLTRSRGSLEKMHPEDREEAVDLHEEIEDSIARGDAGALAESTRGLKEMLFFVEGK